MNHPSIDVLSRRRQKRALDARQARRAHRVPKGHFMLRNGVGAFVLPVFPCLEKVFCIAKTRTYLIEN
ncbi:hypothetical protein BVI2075_180033 [Burkholderia vietnamiensis]|jgi:hypothetical protein|nr:hypothetical protein BVI2075_180033 [Burkholderia vietnamiensis]